MKEYADKTDMQSGQVKEPLVGYASPSVHAAERTAGISSALMDELLHQSNDVKLLIIQKLSESMMTSPKEEKSREEKLAARRKEIEAKLDELHVTGSLRDIVGAIPMLEGEDFDWKKEKEAYLMEKYGL